MRLTIEIEISDTDLHRIGPALKTLAAFPGAGGVNIANTVTADAPTDDADDGKEAAAAKKKAAAEKRKAAAAKKKAKEADAGADLFGDDEDAGEVPTMDDLKNALEKFIASNSVPKARELMQEFDATKVGQIPEERWAEFIAKATA